MSDGIRDVDITYRRLLALKKAHKKDASVAREVFKLLGRSPSKGEQLRESHHEGAGHRWETKRDISRGRSAQDKLHFLNSYCGIASLHLYRFDPPVPKHRIPFPPPVFRRVAPRQCGSCAARVRMIKNLTAQLGRARKKLVSHGLKLDSKNQMTVDDLNSQITSLRSSNRVFSQENSFLRGKVSALSVKNSRLGTELRFSENARLEAEESSAEGCSREVTLFSAGKGYSADTVVTVLELLDLEVADEKMRKVMKSVAKLTGVKLDRDPSPSTVRNIAVASLTVAKAHVHERLDQGIGRGEQLCLYSDETNKLGSKLQCFGAGLVKDDGGQEIFLFGLAQVADKSAQTAFDIMQKRLGSLSRGIGYVLPKVIRCWDELSDTHQQELMKFHVFYCQLHAIANYTNVVLEALAEHRDRKRCSILLSDSLHCLFGDRSAGLHSYSKDRIFHHRQSLKTFIDERGSGRSELIKLGELLDLPIVAEHLQILGLLDQLLTGPLWRLAENVAHVFDTGATVSLLLSWVRECSVTPVSMFSGNCSIPSLHSIAAGDEQFLEKLLSVSPSEASLEAVALVMESSLRYFEHLFEDFIPGGKYSAVVDDVVVDRTRCASATNRFIECAFGFVDRLFNHSPPCVSTVVKRAC
ncbi:hypothetical protein PRIPAC_95428 [Pristionchus pacificus]|uniref:Uncharacterized protein n=1 Tax=Pristionchus pacificus TaxID=54126 RepID=A0A2A6BJ43_PRIPA|nr:hypothetical protein PRIPAC_95428 [Pristionchus pacificus]|eukprot:PDM65846.1 hypothetical protein PRIPAC_45247 [Pristionchus pacificus]